MLSARGNVSENGQPRFFRRIAEGVFDEGDVIRRAHELADFVAAAALHYGFASDRVTALGYSNGANIAAATMLLRPETFSSAILFRAMVPLSQPPMGSLIGRRAFIAAGKFDPIVPLENVERLAALMNARGAQTTLAVHDASHGLTAEDLVAARRWRALEGN